MAKVLVGHSSSGEIQEFDEDGDLTGGTKLRECFFLNFARLLTKDEIKKGSFSLELGIGLGLSGAMHQRIKLTDYNAQNDYRVNSPAGDYAVLYAETSYDGSGSTKFLAGEYANDRVKAGLLYYQAGVAVLTASVFAHVSASTGGNHVGGLLGQDYGDGTENAAHMWFPHMGPEVGNVGTPGEARSVANMLTGSEISSSATALRARMYNVSFNNTTELNSTIYFCRVNHNEFNYSSNPTYLTGSKIRVKNVTTDTPVAYVTGIGLYSSDNELMAVAKLSEPLKKDPTNELTLRVRLDY
jgi:hypothetical protein